MRTMFVWRRASTLPTVIVSADEHPDERPVHAVGRREGEEDHERCRATKPAAFDDTDRNAVTGVGAPS